MPRPVPGTPPDAWGQVKKHVKRTKDQEGGIVTIEAPLHVSNVAVVDPVTGCVLARRFAVCRRQLMLTSPRALRAAVRTAFRFTEEGDKARLPAQ